MDLDRWNGKACASGTGNETNLVELELVGTHIRIAQDAHSRNCTYVLRNDPAPAPRSPRTHALAPGGTTCWDASLVLAKYIERNLSSSLVGKCVVELGSGISGLPGMACALLGASHVLLTDIDGPVLGLLRTNVARNVSTAHVSINGSGLHSRLTRTPAVAELRWGVEPDIDGICASLPADIDYVLAADCVYNEAAVGTLAGTIKRLLERRGKRTTKVLVCNEYRSDSVRIERVPPRVQTRHCSTLISLTRHGARCPFADRYTRRSSRGLAPQGSAR